MSSPPPPPPPTVTSGPPPGGGQPPNAGLGYGPPQQPPSGKPPRAKAPSQFAPLVIVAALVFVAIGVVVLLVTRDSGGSSVDAAAAADGLAEVTDVEFEGGIADLRDCPLGDLDDLSEQIADDLDLDDVLDGDESLYVLEPSDDFPAIVLCTLAVDPSDDVRGPSSVSYLTYEAPRDEDYAAYLEDDAFPEGGVTVYDSVDAHGGTIYPYCSEPDDSELDTICGADWVDDDRQIVIGLDVTVDGDDEDTATAAADALKTLLPGMAEELAAQA